MLKTTVSSARNGSFSFKKRRFLKLIRIFVGIKSFYLTDSQRLACNAKNKCFFASNYNALANIGCMRCQNSLFVKFIH